MLTVNLGTGQGHTVLEVIAAYERACGRSLPHEIVARRPGDVPVTYADATLAKQVLGFHAKHNLDEMCQSSWHWINNGGAHST